MSADSTYFLTIADNSTGQNVAMAFGDFAEINFIGRRHVAKMAVSANDFTVRLVELEPDDIGQLNDDNMLMSDAVKRTVTEFTGDGDTAAIVLKRKLLAEKKEQADEVVTAADQDESVQTL